jgi:HicA toxin of bacterial toxin-antitoxin,
MNNKQRRVLEKIFEKPTRADIRWKDLANLIVALGGVVNEGSGSRVRIHLRGAVAIVHQPHPQRELKKYAVDILRKFFEEIGIEKNEK